MPESQVSPCLSFSLPIQARVVTKVSLCQQAQWPWGWGGVPHTPSHLDALSKFVQRERPSALALPPAEATGSTNQLALSARHT